MACICLGEAPKRPQQQEFPPTPNLTDRNPTAMPSISNNLFDTETVSDQETHASPPLPLQGFNPYCYTLPASPAYSTDSQATPYSLTSILIHLQPHSSSRPISLPILLGSTLSVTMHPQQSKVLVWVPILPIPNHFKLYTDSYIHTTIDHLPNAENLELIL